MGSTLTQEVRKAKEQSLRAHSVATSASRTCAQYLRTRDQSLLLQPLTNRMDAQEVRLRGQSRVISDLLATTRQQQSILVGVFDGSITIPQTAPVAAGPLVGGPYVSQAIFDTHVADSAYARSILSQDISGGGITVDDRLFTVLRDVTDCISRYFPARIACYECVVAFVPFCRTCAPSAEGERCHVCG